MATDTSNDRLWNLTAESFTRVINPQALEDPLAGEVAPLLQAAIKFYQDQTPPFLVKKRNVFGSPKPVFMISRDEKSRDGRPKIIKKTMVHLRTWDDIYGFWTLDLNGERLIVRPSSGGPFGGVKYRVWIGAIEGFEDHYTACTCPVDYDMAMPNKKSKPNSRPWINGTKKSFYNLDPISGFPAKIKKDKPPLEYRSDCQMVEELEHQPSSNADHNVKKSAKLKRSGLVESTVEGHGKVAESAKQKREVFSAPDPSMAAHSTKRKRGIFSAADSESIAAQPKRRVKLRLFQKRADPQPDDIDACSRRRREVFSMPRLLPLLPSLGEKCATRFAPKPDSLTASSAGQSSISRDGNPKGGTYGPRIGQPPFFGRLANYYTQRRKLRSNSASAQWVAKVPASSNPPPEVVSRGASSQSANPENRDLNRQPKFLIRTYRFIITYSKIPEDFDQEGLGEFIMERLDNVFRCITCAIHEHPPTGDHHIYCYIDPGRRMRIKTESFFDFSGVRPDVKPLHTLGTTPHKAHDFVVKHGIIIFREGSPPGPSSKQSSDGKWDNMTASTNKEEFLQKLLEHKTGVQEPLDSSSESTDSDELPEKPVDASSTLTRPLATAKKPDPIRVKPSPDSDLSQGSKDTLPSRKVPPFHDFIASHKVSSTLLLVTVPPNLDFKVVKLSSCGTIAEVSHAILKVFKLEERISDVESFRFTFEWLPVNTKYRTVLIEPDQMSSNFEFVLKHINRSEVWTTGGECLLGVEILLKS